MAHQPCMALALGVPLRAARDCQRVHERNSLTSAITLAGSGKTNAMRPTAGGQSSYWVRARSNDDAHTGLSLDLLQRTPGPWTSHRG